MRAPRPCLCTRQVPVLRIRLRRTWFPVRTILQSSSVVSSIKFCYHPWQFTGYPTLGFQRCAGVVGGVVPLIILAVVVALFFGRRARGRGTQEMPEYYKGQPTSPTLTATSANLPYTSHHVGSPILVHIVRFVSHGVADIQCFISAEYLWNTRSVRWDARALICDYTELAGGRPYRDCNLTGTSLIARRAMDFGLAFPRAFLLSVPFLVRDYFLFRCSHLL